MSLPWWIQDNADAVTPPAIFLIETGAFAADRRVHFDNRAVPMTIVNTHVPVCILREGQCRLIRRKMHDGLPVTAKLHGHASASAVTTPRQLQLQEPTGPVKFMDRPKNSQLVTAE